MERDIETHTERQREGNRKRQTNKNPSHAVKT